MNSSYALGRTCLILICLWFVPFSIDAQPLNSSGTDRYERKSISYIPATYISRADAYQLKHGELEYLIDAVREYIEMPRFDYNALPTEITDRFLEKARERSDITESDIEGLLNRTVVPVILKILDTEKELRARDLVSEYQQQQFIATKAQSYGITAGQLETILNSAYLYIPFVTNIHFSEKKDMITCSLKGGLLWYHVIPDTVNPRVELMDREITFSFGQGQGDTKYRLRGKLLEGDEFALYSAVDNFARNLQIATQAIPEFSLTGQVRYTENEWVMFDLGTREGVKVDDGFFVGEYIKGSTGLTLQRTGFMRTILVGDNSGEGPTFSAALPVTGHGYVKGLSVIEHPRLPLQISLRVRGFDITIDRGYVRVDWPFGSQSILEAYFPKGYSGGTVGLDLEASYFLGRWFNTPMLLFTVGVTGAVIPTEIYVSSFQDGDEEFEQTYPVLGFVRGGITKKYFWRRTGLQFGGELGFGYMSATDQVWLFGEDGLDQYDISLTNQTIGVTVFTGMEYFLTPDVTVGSTVGYQGYPRSTAWSFRVENDSYPLIGGSDIQPAFQVSGLFFNLYLQYRPPALPFDPINLIRATMGI